MKIKKKKMFLVKNSSKSFEEKKPNGNQTCYLFFSMFRFFSLSKKLNISRREKIFWKIYNFPPLFFTSQIFGF